MSELLRVSQLAAPGSAQSSIHYMKMGYNHSTLALKTLGVNSELISTYKAMI